MKRTAAREHRSLEDTLDRLDIVTREPFEDVEALSGCSFERLGGADGRRYFLKHMALEEDWLMRATADVDCRAVAFPASPLYDRLPSTIDDALVDVGGAAGRWWLLMRDVSAELFPKASTVSRSQRDRLFANLAAMYARYTDIDRGAAPYLLGLTDRLGFLSSATLTDSRSRHLEIVMSWWEEFPGTAPPRVIDAVLRAREDPSWIAPELAHCRPTLLHGDLKLPNLGETGERNVLLDWQMCTWGPPALDLAWFVAMNASRCEGTSDEAVESFRNHVEAATGSWFDPADWQRSFDLAVVATMGHFGFEKAHLATRHPDPAGRDRAEADYGWWVARIEEALDRI